MDGVYARPVFRLSVLELVVRIDIGGRRMRLHLYRVFTGPTLVNVTAHRLTAAGFLVTTRGVENVYVQTEHPMEVVLTCLNEGPRRDRWTRYDVHLLKSWEVQ